MKILFLSFTRQDIGVAIATKMITIAMVTQSLEEYLDMLLYDRNIIGPSSEIFGYLRKSSENIEKCLETSFPQNLRKVVGNLRKIIKNVDIGMFM